MVGIFKRTNGLYLIGLADTKEDAYKKLFDKYAPEIYKTYNWTPEGYFRKHLYYRFEVKLVERI